MLVTVSSQASLYLSHHLVVPYFILAEPSPDLGVLYQNPELRVLPYHHSNISPICKALQTPNSNSTPCPQSLQTLCICASSCLVFSS
jgi:hypothetical protein